MGIELWSGYHFFEGSLEATAEAVAGYFSRLARQLAQGGTRFMHVFLDRNSTHKAKMQAHFKELTADLSICCEFHYLAAYSPKLNLVEYAIHLIRQKVLHHGDWRQNLEYFVAQIQHLCEAGLVLTKQQIINVLAHIEELVPKITNLSP